MMFAPDDHEDDRDRFTSTSIEMRNTSASEGFIDTSFIHSDTVSATRLGAKLDPAFNEQTLSNYLINNAPYPRMLWLCGGLHIPMRMNYNDLTMNMLNVWRLLLVAAVVLQLVVAVYSVCIEIDYDVSSLSFLWSLCLLLQCLLIPVTLNVLSERMKRCISLEMTPCIKDALTLSRHYLGVALLLCAVYAAVVAYIYSHNGGGGPPSIENVGYMALYGLLYTMGLFAVSALSTWAVFLMVLDAKTAKMEVDSLTAMAEEQQLTVLRYNQAHERCYDELETSVLLADAVAAVSYMCFICFVAVCLHIDAPLAQKANVFVIGFCGLVRETLILLFVLPEVAAQNAAMDGLSRLLAEREWQNDAVRAGSEDAGTGRNTLGSVMGIANVYANNAPNVVCLRLWALSCSKPIQSKLFGHTLGVCGLRAQLIVTVLLMASVWVF